MPKPTAPQWPGGWDCHVHVFAAGQGSQQGHYAPQHHPLDRIETLAAQHGFSRLVLVQPSVYGADNSLLLSDLQASNGRHRGVVVVNDVVPDAELARWHALGVRGIRCNLVSPVGNHQTNWQVWAPRLRELGWHVQWYAHGDQLDEIVRWQQGTGLPCVLDHVGGIHRGLADPAAAWMNLSALAQVGAWVKLSGWYRLGLAQPYELARIRLAEVTNMFAGRCVWGSDWPHTSFVNTTAPSYAQVWQPLAKLLGAEGSSALNEQAMRLYT
jgi:predicted TIM-barrel fold metal-dependent hydrolase